MKEDYFIRNFIENKLADVCISNISIKRKLNSCFIGIYVANPSLVMGTSSLRLYSLRDDLSSSLSKTFSFRELSINVYEVVNPDSSSKLLADFVRQQLEKRVPFRKAIKNAILKAQKSNVKGIKIQVSGRLNGAEIARTEWIREGQVPLHTLQANIDYFSHKALEVVVVYFFLSL